MVSAFKTDDISLIRWICVTETTSSPQYFVRALSKGEAYVAKCRAPDLQSGGLGLKSSVLLLDGFVFGSPELNSSTLCK